MFQRFSLSIALFLLCVSSQAQDLLTLKPAVGVSFPIGHFASDDMNDPRSGFAGIGGLIELEVGLKPAKNFGLCFYGAMAMYPGKTGNVQGTVNATQGTNLTAASSYYRYGLATGGFIFSGRITERWVLDGRITAGYLWAESPTIEMSENNIIYYKHYRTPGSGPSATASFGFHYVFKRVWFVGATADFIFAYPKFNNAIIEVYNGTQTSTRSDNYHQVIGAINLTGGIGLTF